MVHDHSNGDNAVPLCAAEKSGAPSGSGASIEEVSGGAEMPPSAAVKSGEHVAVKSETSKLHRYTVEYSTISLTVTLTNLFMPDRNHIKSRKVMFFLHCTTHQQNTVCSRKNTQQLLRC